MCKLFSIINFHGLLFIYFYFVFSTSFIESVKEKSKKPNLIEFEFCDSFESTYCLNNGICYKTKSKKRVPSLNDHLDDDELFCSCTSKYTGLRCETEIATTKKMIINDDLPNRYFATDDKKKLMNKTFRNDDVSATIVSSKFLHIKCPDWYNCLNGGTCIVDLVVGPKCLCLDEFEGLNCGKAKNCPNMNECTKSCDFGYKRKFGCDTCECKCVTEYNYFTEMKYELINNTQNMTTKFCNKVCPYGYEKDERECYKCSCIKASVTTTNIYTDEPFYELNKARELSCPTEFCKDGELCRYFNSTIYKCPQDQFDCKLFDDQEFVPICFPAKINEMCLEPLITGECQRISTRYYFDLTERRCKAFDYGGCGFSRNNFETMQECTKQCGQVLNDMIESESDPEYNEESEEEENVINDDDDDGDDIETTEDGLVNYNFDGVTDTPIIDQNDLTTTQFEDITTTTENIPELETTTETAQKSEFNENSFYATESPLNEAMGCDWVCDLSCPFGYKMDLKTKCYKCECIDLNMTSCGIPCYPTGTKECLSANRANSRPACVCNDGFDGVYCQTLTTSFNFSVRVDQLSFELTENIIHDIKMNVSRQLIEQFQLNTKQFYIISIRNDPAKSIYIDFSIHGSDFSNLTQFYSLVDMIYNQLNNKKVFVKYYGHNFALVLNCDKTEEYFSIDLEEKYFSSIEKLKKFISDLKEELIITYKFKMEAIKVIKIVVEPRLAIEFLISNFNFDPEFCTKSYILNNDVRLKNFILLTKLDANMFDTNEGSDWNANYMSANEHGVLTAHNTDNNNFLTQPSTWLSNSAILIIVVASCSIILFAFITIAAVTSMRRKRQRRLSKLSESSTITNGRPDKRTRDFVGYFLPSYGHNHRKLRKSEISNDDDNLTSVSAHRINLIPY